VSLFKSLWFYAWNFLPPADPAPTPSPEPFFDGILNLLGKCRNVYDIVTVWDTEEVTQLYLIFIYMQSSFGGFYVFYK
jgi:hypothetical protein